jgi:penicillin amidase
MRKATLFFMSLLIAAVAAACSASKLISYKTRPDAPSQSGELRLRGPEKQVKVVFDEHLVPHVIAGGENDLAFAMGYLHARERLFQMDLLRRVACGRLAEMFGDKPRSSILAMASTLAVDRWFRVMGICRSGLKSYGAMSAQSKKLGEAYAAGINEYIRTGTLPIEYRLLGQRPERWDPADTMAVARINGWYLSANSIHEIVRYLMRAELGEERQKQTFPGLDHWGPPIIDRDDLDYRKVYPKEAPKPEQAPASPGSSLDPDWGTTARALLAMSHDAAKGLKQYLPPDASNNWAVAGSRTESGKPVFANDPHLQHTAPGVFYLMHLRTPSLDVVGATMPGTPAVILGHNRHVAWGLTTTFADTQDIYLEKVDPRDPAKYLFKDASEPFRVEKEILRERLPDGTFREHAFNLRFTRHGPVLNDAIGVMLSKDAPPMALRSTIEEPSDDLDVLMKVARSANLKEFRAALSGWNTPIQNWVAADDSGHIMYFPAGRVPVRKGWDGSMPVAGWTGGFEWEGYIPFDELPQMTDPKSGMIVTANNTVVPADDYPRPYSLDAIPAYRAARIRELLLSRPKWTAEGIREIQLDIYVKQAERLLPPLVETMRKAEMSETEEAAFKLLESWDRRAAADNIGATLYFATYHEAWELTLMDDLSQTLYEFLSAFGYLSGFFDRLWAENPDAAIWDLKGTDNIREKRNDILEMAYKRAVANLKKQYGGDVYKWKWGRVHQIEFTHPFGEVKEVRSTFNHGPLPHPGARDTVWLAEGSWNDADYSYKAWHGPAFRHVVDMASVDSAGMITDLGQSGWPSTPAYSNAFNDWNSGRLWNVSLDEVKFSTGAKGVLYLLPEE